jgi:hypothetical protein
LNRRSKQSKTTKLAKGQPCLIRLPGICNGNPETTVPCHFRLSGISGMGFISPEFLIAFGCSSCHAYVDSHRDAETQLAFAHGVFRTQVALGPASKIVPRAA